MRYAALAVGILACASVFASDPGSPLDCGDWVFLDPSLHCSVLAPPGQLDETSVLLRQGSNKFTDNASGLYALRVVYPTGTSPNWDDAFARMELVKYDQAQGERVVAYIADRQFGDHVRPRNASCNGVNNCQVFYDGSFLPNIATFDATAGRLIVPLRSYCSNSGSGCPNPYGGGWWVASIEGFASLFDVLQTYSPQPKTLSFTVPYMPEGLAAADHFDTYVGSLTKPIDFTAAQPLVCGFPSMPPHVGDFETIADPLPDPAPGTGRYYITATTYQGQRRDGRKTTNGHLSARDPSALPACAP